MGLPPEEAELPEVPDVRMPLLRMAFVQRSMDENIDTCERCAHCQRTLLTGEHVFICGPGRTVCELCIGLEGDMPRESRLVHGSELGQTIRIVDRRVRRSRRPRGP